MPADFLYSFMFTVARSTNQICFNMGLNLGLLIGLHFTCSWYLVTKLHAGCVEAVAVLYMSILGIFVCLAWRYTGLDWEKLSVAGMDEFEGLNEAQEYRLEVANHHSTLIRGRAAGIELKEIIIPRPLFKKQIFSEENTPQLKPTL